MPGGTPHARLVLMCALHFAAAVLTPLFTPSLWVSWRAVCRGGGGGCPLSPRRVAGWAVPLPHHPTPTAFYTSRYGYKMCLRVYLNGDGTGRGTHLSLFFVVMKGPNDALLRWPFNQKV